MTKLFIGLTAAVFLLYGVGFIAAPVALSTWVTGTAPSSTVALTDMRATYGGMSLGVGLILLLAAARPALHRFGLQCIIAVLGAMALGRGVGMLLDGASSATMLVYLLLEIVAVVIAALLLKRGPAS